MYVNLIEHFAYTERTILLNLKLLDTDLKIILLDYQNNFVRILIIMSDAAKNFYILAASLSIIILIVFNKIIFFFINIILILF